MNWYDKCWSSVRWGNAISKKLKIIDGASRWYNFPNFIFSVHGCINKTL